MCCGTFWKVCCRQETGYHRMQHMRPRQRQACTTGFTSWQQGQQQQQQHLITTITSGCCQIDHRSCCRLRWNICRSAAESKQAAAAAVIDNYVISNSTVALGNGELVSSNIIPTAQTTAAASQVARRLVGRLCLEELLLRL
jgi:hypothetical protein